MDARKSAAQTSPVAEPAVDGTDDASERIEAILDVNDAKRKSREPTIRAGSPGSTATFNHRDRTRTGTSPEKLVSTSTRAGTGKASSAKPKAPGKTKAKSRGKEREPAYSGQELAVALITSIETLTSAVVGEPVPMAEMPKLFMTQSLGNILERMDERQAEQISKIFDPLAVVVCSALYMGQVLSVLQRKQQEAQIQNEVSEATTDDPGNDGERDYARNGRREIPRRNRADIGVVGISDPLRDHG